MRCKHAKYERYSPQFVAPFVLAPPVRSSPSSLNRSSPGSLLPQLPAHRDLVLGPFKQKKVHIDKCAPPEGESSRNIRYTVVIAAAQRVQSFCSPGSASPPPVSMRASCADSKCHGQLAKRAARGAEETSWWP